MYYVNAHALIHTDKDRQLSCFLMSGYVDFESESETCSVKKEGGGGKRAHVCF